MYLYSQFLLLLSSEDLSSVCLLNGLSFAKLYSRFPKLSSFYDARGKKLESSINFSDDKVIDSVFKPFLIQIQPLLEEEDFENLKLGFRKIF